MSVVTFFGYDDAVALENEACRVVLTGHGGGRVIEYALQGRNAVFLAGGHFDQAGWKHRGPDGSLQEPPAGGPVGGRCDIGPEMLNPPRPTLWLGSWSLEITGPRSAVMTSEECPDTGAQLVREFALDGGASSHLQVTQTIRNVSDTPKQYFHWARHFAEGGGVFAVPLSENSRYPNKYVMYGAAEGGGGAILTAPEDPMIRERGGFLEILGPPKGAKLGIDSHVGWFAYVAPSNLAWVKRYPTFPDRAYGEVAGFPLCVYYPASLFVELEPIGPRQTIAPGGEAAFTEDWFLLEHEMPRGGAQLDLPALTAQVAAAEVAAAAASGGGGDPVSRSPSKHQRL
jgi:hypothetical protein